MRTFPLLPGSGNETAIVGIARATTGAVLGTPGIRILFTASYRTTLRQA